MGLKKTNTGFLLPEHELKPKQLKCNTSPPVVPHNSLCLHCGTGCIQNETHSTGLANQCSDPTTTLISILPTCVVVYMLNFPGKGIYTLYKHRNDRPRRERYLHLLPSSASEEHRDTGNSTATVLFTSSLLELWESPSDSNDLCKMVCKTRMGRRRQCQDKNASSASCCVYKWKYPIFCFWPQHLHQPHTQPSSSRVPSLQWCFSQELRECRAGRAGLEQIVGFIRQIVPRHKVFCFEFPPLYSTKNNIKNNDALLHIYKPARKQV